MKKLLSIMLLFTALIFVGCSDNTKETTDETNIESKDENETTVEELETKTESKEETELETKEDTSMEEDDVASDDFRIDDDKQRNVEAEITNGTQSIKLEYDAKGDRINKLIQHDYADISSLNLKDLEGADAKGYIANIEQLTNKYNQYDEVKFESNINTKEITSKLDIDLSKDGAYEKLLKDNIVVNQNTDLGYMSLTEEIKRLKGFGYEIKGADDVIDKIKGYEQTSSPLLPQEKINDDHLGSAYINDQNIDTVFFYFGEGNNVYQIVQNKIFYKDVFNEDDINLVKTEFDNLTFPDNIKDYIILDKEEDDEKLVLNYNYKIENKEVLNNFIEAEIINPDQNIENPEVIKLDITLNNLKKRGFEVIEY